jgi:hypothetical protein
VELNIAPETIDLEWLDLAQVDLASIARDCREYVWCLGHHPSDLFGSQQTAALPDAASGAEEDASDIDAAVTYAPKILDRESDPPYTQPDPQRILCYELPSSLRMTGILARRCPHISLLQATAQSNGEYADYSSQLLEQLREFLHNLAQTQTNYYTSSDELLQKLGWPITPQPTFERNAEQLHRALLHLKEDAWLRDLKEVNFYVKIHSVGRFNLKNLQADSELAEFLQHYEAMRLKLSALDSLKFTFFGGRTFDLRQFAERVPYDVDKLNHIFNRLNAEQFAISEFTPSGVNSRVNREYQISLHIPVQISPSLSLWLKCANLRTELLWASLHTAPLPEDPEILDLLSRPCNEPKLWHDATKLLQQAHHQGRLTLIAGRILQLLEERSSDTALLLWEICCCRLDLPGLSAEKLLSLLPPLMEISADLTPAISPIIQRHLASASAESPLLHYALALPPAFGFQTLTYAQLEAEALYILAIESPDAKTDTLQEYLKLAHFAIKKHLHKPTKIDSAAQSTARPLWIAACAWASHLLELHTQARELLKAYLPPSVIAAKRCVTIALYHKQPLLALAVLSDEIGSNLAGLPVKQRMELEHQLHNTCQSQHLCRSCPLYGNVHYCPDNMATLLNISHPSNTPPAQYLAYRLAKRVRTDLEQNSSAFLRQLLDTPIARQSNDLQDAILQQMALRGEASLVELHKLAKWSTDKNDLIAAQKYRETILQLDADDAENIQRLADLYILQDEIMLAMQMALKATHLYPRRFPLETWLDSHRKQLFAFPQILRQAIIELPAHPAFSPLSTELQEREKVLQKLQSTLDEAEQAIKQHKLHKALIIAEQSIQRYADNTPQRFFQIAQEITKQRDQLLRDLRKAQQISSPHKRTKTIEDIADAASQTGLIQVADLAYRELLADNPQHGKVYIKWARCSTEPQQQHTAYRKAIELAQLPENLNMALDEYAHFAEQRSELPLILDFVVDLAQNNPNVDEDLIEKILTRIVEKYGNNSEYIDTIRTWIDAHPSAKSFVKLRRTMSRFDDLEPWKRALLSIKTRT